MSDVETLIELLDHRYATMDLWRTMGNTSWCVKVETSDGRSKTANEPTLTEALVAAGEIQFLPAVPPQPPLERFEVVKNASETTWKWQVVSADRASRAGSYATKREAAAVAERATELSSERFWTWQSEHADTVASGVEGIDYEVTRA